MISLSTLVPTNITKTHNDKNLFFCQFGWSLPTGICLLTGHCAAHCFCDYFDCNLKMTTYFVDTIEDLVKKKLGAYHALTIMTIS